MFPVYFPTTKKAEAPEIFKIDPYADSKIHFETKWRHGLNFESEEEQAKHVKLLATGQKLDDANIPCLLLAGYFVPLESGLICLRHRYDRDDFTLAYDAKTRTCTPATHLFRPKSIDNAYAHYEPKMLSDTLANLIARTTGLLTNKLIGTPNAVYFKFKNHFEKLPSPAYRDNARVDIDVKTAKNIERGVALTKARQWVEYAGSTATDTNTGALVSSEFKLDDAILYIPDTTNNVFFSDDKTFSFNRREVHPTFSRSSFHFIVDSYVEDGDIGSKLLKSMGIDYDYYDDITFTEDGFIDPVTFTSGKYNFGVMKTNAWVFDTDKLKDFVKDNPLDDDPERGTKSPFKLRTAAVSRLNDFNNATSRILSLNIGKDGLNEVHLNFLVNQWGISSTLRWLEGIGEEQGYMFGHGNEEERKFINEKKRTTLLKYIKQIEIEVPIFTPRFNEDVNAQLNEVMKDIKGYYMEFASLCEYSKQAVEDVPFF